MIANPGLQTSPSEVPGPENGPTTLHAANPGLQTSPSEVPGPEKERRGPGERAAGGPGEGVATGPENRSIRQKCLIVLT
jgi:hypothetical protein